jgi:hypothetical protein
MPKERIMIVKFDRGGSLVILGYYKTKQEACNALSSMTKNSGCYVCTGPGEFFNAAGEKVKLK